MLLNELYSTLRELNAPDPELDIAVFAAMSSYPFEYQDGKMMFYSQDKWIRPGLMPNHPSLGYFVPGFAQFTANWDAARSTIPYNWELKNLWWTTRNGNNLPLWNVEITTEHHADELSLQFKGFPMVTAAFCYAGIRARSIKL